MLVLEFLMNIYLLICKLLNFFKKIFCIKELLSCYSKYVLLLVKGCLLLLLLLDIIVIILLL